MEYEEEDIERKRIEKNRLMKKYNYPYEELLEEFRYDATTDDQEDTCIIREKGKLQKLSIKKWLEYHKISEDRKEEVMNCLIETAKLYELEITPDNMIILDIKKLPRDKDVLEAEIGYYFYGKKEALIYEELKKHMFVTPEILDEITKGVKAEGWGVKWTEEILQKRYIEYLIPLRSKINEIEKKRGEDFYYKEVAPQEDKLEGKEELDYLDRVLKEINEEDKRRTTPMPKQVIQHYRNLYKNQNVKKQTIKHISKVLMISTPSSDYTRLKVTLHRLVDKKILRNPARGVYAARKKLFEIDL